MMPTNPIGQKMRRIEPKQKHQRVAAYLAGARRSWARDTLATRVARGARVRVRPRVRERVGGRAAEPG
jgi:hypothetical protein